MVSLLVCSEEIRRARALSASVQQKARRGVPPGRLGVVLVNTLFWKILVTRVKRKIVSACLVCLKTLFSARPREGTPRRSRRGDPVAGTQRSALDSHHKRVYARPSPV